MKNKLYKILGVVLSFALVVTAIFCLPAVAENSVDQVIVKDYYVQSPGHEAIKSGNYEAGLGTKESPAATVADLIAIINDDPEMTANDTANVYIMQRSDWNVYDMSNIGRELDESGNRTGNIFTPYHSITSWVHATAHNDSVAVEDHSWKMVVKADPNLTNAKDGKIYLSFNDRIGANLNLVAKGPTVFENVVLVSTRQDYMSVVPNGNDVMFGAETAHGAFANMDYNYELDKDRKWNGTIANRTYNRFQLYAGAITDTDGVTVTFNQPYTISNYFYIPASNGANAKVDGDINLIFNNKDISITKCLWGSDHASRTHTFSSININIKQAKALTNVAHSKGGVAVTNGVQVIVNKDTAFTTDLTDLSTVTIPTNDAGVKKYWKLINTGASNLISFVTDENNKAIVGKYNIATGYVATATDDKGNTYDSKNGVLDLSQVPGTYTVTFEKKSVTKDYYVKSMGYQALNEGKYSTEPGAINGSGNPDYEIGTKENPAATVADAIRLINKAGLGADDTANIYIMQNDNYKEYDGSEFGKAADNDYRIPYHNMTSWVHTPKNDRSTVVPDAYECTLVIKPYPESNTTPVYLAYSSTFPSNCNLVLNGPTVFEGVTLLSTRTTDMYIIAQGSDLTLNDGTKFAVIPHRYTEALTTWNGTITGKDGLKINAYDGNITDKDGINITINNAYRSGTSKYFALTGGKTTEAITGDVNLTVDNSKAIIPLTWGSTSDVTLTNVNINIKSAEEIRNFNNTKPLIINGGLQILVNSTVNWNTTNLSSDIATIAKDENGNEKYWFITDATDVEDCISFCVDENSNSVLGKYIVADGYNVVAVNTTTGESIWSSDGELDLTGKPGSYTIMSKEAETHNYDEYINYRNGLGNTYSKINKDKKLNVVYFGGSVTSGSGSSNSDLYSWRGRVGNWLTTNFPAANISNIKQSIGETGTYLGCYRVARDVVSKAPDLPFIDYSINDYYDQASTDRAQMQFETVVRQVKTAYPNCDIVTILVTDYGNIKYARENKLHKQAQAHEDISKEYNIPSIYVGGALAEALGENWTKQSDYANDSVWCQYVKDGVHPLDAGYEIYFNVIKEFLNNELNYTEYDGTIKTNPMPGIQNKYKYLFDGDITYIDEGDRTKVTYDTSDTNITYNPDATGIVSKEDYSGLIYVTAGAKESEITVKFTGTELIMVTTSGHDKTVDGVANTFEVSLDGGKTWTTGYYAGKNPTVIAAGLPTGDHTAIIRPSSCQQTRIAGFYSRDVEKSSNILNIADLVKADEEISASTTEAYYDYNNDDVIDAKDIATVKKILLNNK